MTSSSHRRHRWVAYVLVLAGVLAVTAMSASLGGQARAATGTAAPIAAPGGKCVDVSGDDSGGNGAAVQLWDCLSGAVDQHWTAATDGTIRTLGRCLATSGNATTAGTTVELWECNGAAAQQWQQQADGSLLNPQSGRCLDDPAGNTGNGIRLQIWDCNRQWPQVFTVGRGTSSGAITLRAAPTRCVDVAGASNANGAFVGLYDCNGTAAQQWMFGADQTIRALGKCLDVEGNSVAAGAKIHLWDCLGTGNQKWVPQANGALLNPVSGRCLDDPAGKTSNGTQLQIWDCNNAGPQAWNLPTTATVPTTPPPITPPFGNTNIHPEKIGIYAIPDMAYGSPDTVEASFRALHSLLPAALLRWDNETGHYRETPAQVEDYIRRANNAGVPMIIAACCVDGYDNFWARGGQQPTVSIRQIADGPYLAFADRMRRTYPNVKFVETINEPDTSWFVSDPDNGSDWSYYMSKLYAATGNDTSHLMGPATAFRTSTIWNDTIARSEITQVSYHTYGGWSSLSDVPGKNGTWVTEYGDDGVPDAIEHSPGYELRDLWRAERAGKLSGNIRQIFYVDLQSMLASGAQENGHYAFHGRLRGFAAYQALGNVSPRVYTDPGAEDFMAADDGHGGFAALVFNGSATSSDTGTRTIPSTSLAPGAPLYVLTIANRATGAADCQPLSAQSPVTASARNGAVTLTLRGIDPLAAAFISTAPCTELMR